MRLASFGSRSIRGSAALLALAAAGCSSLFGLEDRERVRVVGTIGFYGDPVRIEVPEVVTRGRPFDVKVTTYGGGCISQGDTEVEVQGSSAVVTPYDLELRSRDLVCTQELRMFAHVASVRFDTPGPAVVTVRGMQQPEGAVVTFRRDVTVQ